jgi:hypothetical protein
MLVLRIARGTENVIQKALRHKNLEMTSRYTHAVNRQQFAAQGLFWRQSSCPTARFI